MRTASACWWRKRSLEISENRFRMLVAGTTSLVWLTDAGGTLLTPQPEWEEFTGRRPEQYGEMGGLEAVHPDDRESVAQKWREAIATHEGFTTEFRIWHQPSQQYRDVMSRGVPLMAGAGEIVQWVGTITDVTERRRLEEKLQQAAKLESLGVLAGGIAHDFNNLLVGIMGNASLLQSMVRDHEQLEITEQIVKAGERAATLTQQMLAYSGRGRFVVEPTDLSAETGEIVALLTSSIPKNVELVLNLAEDLPAVDVDRAQFQQLLMNLVINGAEAVDGPSGRVTVTTGAQLLSAADIARQFPGDPLQPGNYVVLEVRDTGHGMDQATQARIFDPFFTTKFTGRGLGLAAVLGIVRGHKGAIRVESAVNAGSTLRVLFPAGGAAFTASLPAQREPALNGMVATILVIDDEDIVRRVAESVLTRHGYQVLLAENGQQGIQLFQENRDRVEAILLDLTMPVMNGEDTLPRLREIRPDVRILASSGYSQSEAARRFGSAIDGFIQKPYAADALMTAVTALLPSARAADTNAAHQGGSS